MFILHTNKEPQMFYLHKYKKGQPDQCIVCKYNKDTAEVSIVSGLVTSWKTVSERSNGMMEFSEIKTITLR
jgi:hypothetical protein